nr:hypothetical protein [Clostridia bacterium]
MTELKKALYAFWSQFGVRAFLDDDVPADAELPYITYNVSESDLNGQTLQTAFAWCGKEKPYGNAWRTTMMDRIAEAIPVNGRIIRVGSGYVIIYRNDASFLSDWKDPNDPSVIGARVGCILQHYTV